MFVPGKLLQPSLMFAGMARAYAIEEPYPLWGWLQPYAQTLHTQGTNALAHYENT